MLKTPENLRENWRSNTLEDLEQTIWPDKIEFDSYLVRTTTALTKKPLNAFTIEDLRIMIGQNFGLDYLMPLAIEKLTEDLFAEGDFYEGDLLQNVLKINSGFWDNNQVLWQNLHELIKHRMEELTNRRIDAAVFIENKASFKK